MSKYERLPVGSRPGFDCRRDNSNCPACSRGDRGDHGIYGGGYWFPVATVHDGRRVVLVLEVLGIAYPPSCPPLPLDSLRRPRGAVITIHRELATGAKCDWMPAGSGCDNEVAGYMRAQELYKEFGNPTTDPTVDLSSQSEEFWQALERQLEAWKVPSEPWVPPRAAEEVN